jgi:hypothetical protein
MSKQEDDLPKTYIVEKITFKGLADTAVARDSAPPDKLS